MALNFWEVSGWPKSSQSACNGGWMKNPTYGNHHLSLKRTGCNYYTNHLLDNRPLSPEMYSAPLERELRDGDGGHWSLSRVGQPRCSSAAKQWFIWRGRRRRWKWRCRVRATRPAPRSPPLPPLMAKLVPLTSAESRDSSTHLSVPVTVIAPIGEFHNWN